MKSDHESLMSIMQKDIYEIPSAKDAADVA